jgi:predicted nucleic acid-binding protein
MPSELRQPCLELLRAVGAGDAEGRTSTAALEEVWFLELSGRIGDLTGLTSRAYDTFTPLLPVTDEAFRRALALESEQLGANDRLHAGTCLANGIEIVVSADAGFDRVRGLRRVDPLDAGGLRRLLAR